jgi:hypothetical protein
MGQAGIDSTAGILSKKRAAHLYNMIRPAEGFGRAGPGEQARGEFAGLTAGEASDGGPRSAVLERGVRLKPNLHDAQSLPRVDFARTATQ